jgi:hypothetical protein
VTGILVAVTLGFLVPYGTDEDALTTQIWKHLFGLPAAFALIQLFFLMFVFTYDSPSYYETKNDHESYQNSMNKLYSNHKYVAVLSSLLDEQSVSLPVKTNELSWGQLFTHPHRKPLIIGLLLGVFHQATGISSVTFFSNEIFAKGRTGESAEFAARIGTFGTGIAGVLAAVTAIIVAKHYGRKTILLVGEIAMAFLLAFLSH